MTQLISLQRPCPPMLVLRRLALLLLCFPHLSAGQPQVHPEATAAAAAGEDDEENSPLRRRQRRAEEEPALVTPLEEENRIIGGVNAEAGEFPFYVKFEGGVLCGGSLLSPNRVLTAGHCIKNNGWPRSVRVGPTHHRNGEIVRVKCGVVHPGYLSPFITVLADVAILKLETNVTSVTSFVELLREEATNAPSNATGAPTGALTTSPTGAPTSNPTMSPTANPTTRSPTTSPTGSPTGSPTSSPTSSPTTCPTRSPTASPTPNPTNSPTASPTPAPTPSPSTGGPKYAEGTFVQLNKDGSYPSEEGQDLTVIGFGKVANNGQTSTTLRKVGTYFVPREKCLELYNDAIVRPEAHLCADVPNAGDCNGDSGGPLMDANKVQVGIVSFGYGGCASEYQDVYAKVSSYVDWIEAQMTDESCPDLGQGGGSGGGGGGVSCFLDYAGAVIDRVTRFFGRLLGR